MKKFITVLIVAVICMSLFACAAISSKPNVPAEVDISQFPDAKEFDVFEWPSTGLAAEIPTPMWSNRGEIITDSETNFWSEVGYTTLEDYDGYVKTCQDAGFATNSYFMPELCYYGENPEGLAVLITYTERYSCVTIQIALDTSDWNIWW